MYHLNILLISGFYLSNLSSGGSVPNLCFSQVSPNWGYLRIMKTEPTLSSLPLTSVELLQIYTSSDLPASSGSLWRHHLCVLRSALCGLLASTVFSFLVLEVELPDLQKDSSILCRLMTFAIRPAMFLERCFPSQCGKQVWVWGCCSLFFNRNIVGLYPLLSNLWCTEIF